MVIKKHNITIKIVEKKINLLYTNYIYVKKYQIQRIERGIYEKQ